MRTRLGLLAALAALPLLAQRGNPSMLVSAGWLAGHLRDESLVILHVGSQKDYEVAHIPGARLVTLAGISVTGENGLRLELPPVNALEETFGRLGVTPSSRVIVYAGTDSVQSATRVWFTLDYLGLGNRASLLDGGLTLWQAEKRPLATEAMPVEAREITSSPAPDRIVNAAWVQAHLADPQVQLLDARLPEYYSGANAGGMPRAGHIPGARSVPYTSLLDEHGRLKPGPELRAIMSAGGAAAAALTVTYCHIGQQATVLYFVARYLGLDVRLYDGSFQDWSMRRDLPVEPPPGP
jgi:thiosulfate/3-mercaptopyruvate sulfurtransferase